MKVEERQCRDESVKNLLGPLTKLPPFKGLRLFGPLLEKLYQYGYVPGLTHLSIPYDWRLSFKKNQVNSNFKNYLNHLYDIIEKKVLIVGHSFGNLNIYHQLTEKLNFEEK